MKKRWCRGLNKLYARFPAGSWIDIYLFCFFLHRLHPILLKLRNRPGRLMRGNHGGTEESVREKGKERNSRIRGTSERLVEIDFLFTGFGTRIIGLDCLAAIFNFCHSGRFLSCFAPSYLLSPPTPSGLMDISCLSIRLGWKNIIFNCLASWRGRFLLDSQKLKSLLFDEEMMFCCRISLI